MLDCCSSLGCSREDCWLLDTRKRKATRIHTCAQRFEIMCVHVVVSSNLQSSDRYSVVVVPIKQYNIGCLLLATIVLFTTESRRGGW
jgi:hypothetical protein